MSRLCYLFFTCLFAYSFSSHINALQLNRFSWKSCGETSDPIKITQLDLAKNESTPDFIYITGKGKVAYNISSPIKGEIKISRWMIWGWVPIPCIDNFGSCHYEDICTLSPYTKECPDVYIQNGLICHCPILQGRYAAKRFPINLNVLPHWLEAGSYRVRLTVGSKDEQFLCLEMTVNI